MDVTLPPDDPGQDHRRSVDPRLIVKNSYPVVRVGLRSLSAIRAVE